MKNIFLACLLLNSGILSAQYYYNDIVGTQEMNRQMKSFVTNKVRTVSATGYDQNNVKATDFVEFQEVKENGNALKVTSHTAISHTVTYNRFDGQGRLISSTDSSGDQLSTITYQYDAAGRITRVQNTTKDSSSDFNQVEVHQWTYDDKGKPRSMWRIISGSEKP